MIKFTIQLTSMIVLFISSLLTTIFAGSSLTNARRLYITSCTNEDGNDPNTTLCKVRAMLGGVKENAKEVAIAFTLFIIVQGIFFTYGIKLFSIIKNKVLDVFTVLRG